jgi:CubicO group peptidase (beta-lactamase class C family)
MAHTSGMGTDAGDEGPFGEHCNRTTEALRIFKDDRLRFEPGTSRRFSSYGWILVSAAVEAAAREPFMTFMRRQIFAPLGMEDTREDSITETIPNVPTFYFPRFAADTKYGPDVMRPIDLSCYAGAAAFLSTPSDLVRFGLAISNGTLLQSATVQTLQGEQTLRSGEMTGYGLGWDIEPITLAGRQTRWVGHDGLVLGGPAMALVTVPDTGLVVAVASNTPYAKPEELAVRIAEIFAAGKR